MGYAVAGALFAFLWTGGADEPAWVHASRSAFLLLSLPPILLPTNRRLAAAFLETTKPARASA
ncbi:hypothetical protein B1H19_03090 [Streptomyces gilvosporeus]|uniref:Uncharacterized protein n=2 Tax=Streptomyces gilvosporeus TaxID=553510 RepID=A0A1V0TK58_9ACTN|nr:hypothetical protein B1H19_03090 [Streptomyces gilvosporeus]